MCAQLGADGGLYRSGALQWGSVWFLVVELYAVSAPADRDASQRYTTHAVSILEGEGQGGGRGGGG